MKDYLAERMDSTRYACIDSDEAGLNWWDYAGTERESKYGEDTLRNAVKMAGGKDLIFVSCLNPLDYFQKTDAPEEIECSFFIALNPSDEVIEQRLKARPAERGFTSDEKIKPHIEYNAWFRRNRSKFQLYIDNTEISEEETAKIIAEFIGRQNPIRQMQMINDDYSGHVEKLRHACRGILVKDREVLLCYEPNNNMYIIPDGGMEGKETCEECCEREMLEETGIRIRAAEEYLDIEELFDVWKHINHYFICEFIEDTGCQHLTEVEKQAGYTCVWMSLSEALAIFSKYEDYHDKDIAVYGLYKREYTALKEYENTVQSQNRRDH